MPPVQHAGKEGCAMAKKITIENDPVEGEDDEKNPPISVSIE